MHAFLHWFSAHETLVGGLLSVLGGSEVMAFIPGKYRGVLQAVVTLTLDTLKPKPPAQP